MRRTLLALAVIGVLASGTRALAQSSIYTQTQLNSFRRQNSAQYFTPERLRRDVYRQSVPQYGFNTLNRDLFKSALTGRPLQKPFSSVSNRSSVTPYLGLSAPFSSTAEQYYTQVRPQLQQQKINQQLAARNAQMQHQLNSIAAQPPYAIEGTDQMSPTGHVAVFMNYGGYYQPIEVPRR
jgi:hypothetical protein